MHVIRYALSAYPLSEDVAKTGKWNRNLLLHFLKIKEGGSVGSLIFAEGKRPVKVNNTSHT